MTHAKKRMGLVSIALGLLVFLVAALNMTVEAASGPPKPGVSPDGSQGQATAPASAFPPILSTEFLPGAVNLSKGFIDHAGRLLPYAGAATCLECHPGEVQAFAASNHYLWQGKLGAINDFCEYPDINLGPAKLTTVFGTQLDGGCLTCHAGLGERPSSTNAKNADCLVCHAVEYRRTLVNLKAGWRFAPDRAAMPATITIQEEPARYACLTCHAYAGGGHNNKRGDISSALVNPTPDQDVHMGNGMTCVDCHTTQSHHIAGRGVDMRIDEGVPMRPCSDCHNPSQDHNDRLVRHLDKVACQTCHIPAYARAFSTDVLRDFRAAEVNPRGLYEPVLTRQSNVIPTYAFWNGASGFYNFRQPAAANQLMAWPLGNINDGKLFPFKLHKAIQPQDLVLQAILPVKAGILFQTGNVDQAIRVGAQETGFDLSRGYTFVNTQRLMGIFHEMPSADLALRCADCHDTDARINFTALGYAPLSTRNGKPLCASCHSAKTQPDFYKLHDKHVGDKKISCNQCHTFTR